MNAHVVLLNASYEPLGNVSFKHAVRMLFREVAIVEEGNHRKGDRTPAEAGMELRIHPFVPTRAQLASAG